MAGLPARRSWSATRETGAMDKVDGPYYFFPLIKRLRDNLPAWLPLVGVDLGDTNVVPVDYVADAMDHLAHLPGLDGEAFHLVNPEPQRVGRGDQRLRARPRARRSSRRRVDRSGAATLLPAGARARCGCSCPALRSAPAQALLDQTIGVGIPRRGARRTSRSSPRSTPATPRRRWPAPASRCPTSSPTPARCGATGRTTSTRDRSDDRALARRCTGKHVVITGASSGIGQVDRAQGRPGRRRSRSWSPAARTSSRRPAARSRTAAAPPTSTRATSPTSRRSTRSCEQLLADPPRIDFVVNNAGRSIRRSLQLSLRPLPRLRAHHAAQLLRRDPAGDGRCCRRCASGSAATSSTSPRSACRPTRRASRRTSPPRPRSTPGATSSPPRSSATASPSPASTCRWCGRR